MSNEKPKLEVSDKKLSFVVGGKNIASIVNELLPLSSKYPKIIEIINVYEKGDYDTLLKLLQEFASAHPECAYIFND